MRTFLARALLVGVWLSCLLVFGLWLIEVVRHRDEIGGWIIGTALVCLLSVPILSSRLRSHR